MLRRNGYDSGRSVKTSFEITEEASLLRSILLLIVVTIIINILPSIKGYKDLKDFVGQLLEAPVVNWLRLRAIRREARALGIDPAHPSDFWVFELFDTFMEGPTWNHSLLMLRAWKFFLLSDKVKAILRSTSSSLEEAGEDTFVEAHTYIYQLRQHFQLLELVSKFGLRKGSKQFRTKLHQERALQIKRVKNGLPSRLDIKPWRLFPAFNGLYDLPITFIPLIKKIENASLPEHQRRKAKLLRKAIDRVEAGESDLFLWIILQSELALTLIYDPFGNHADNIEQAINVLQPVFQLRSYGYDEGRIEEWLRAQYVLGHAYLERVLGNRSENIALAWQSFRALYYTSPDLELGDPTDYIFAKNGRANALMEGNYYVKGAENIEAALQMYSETLEFNDSDYARISHGWDKKPFDYRSATIQNNLGTAYLERVWGNTTENANLAIAAFEAALRVRTRHASPYDWAVTQFNLGIAYATRSYRDRVNNYGKAIATFKAALQVFTRDAYPYDWALTQQALGTVYSEQSLQSQVKAYESALTAYLNALQVLTLDTFPIEHCSIQWLLAILYEAHGQWENAHQAYLQAREAQRTLSLLATTVDGRMTSVIENASRNLYIRDAQVMLQMNEPDLAAIAVALEEGRSQVMRLVLDLDIMDLVRVKDAPSYDRAQALRNARDAWRKAQNSLVAPYPEELEVYQQIRTYTEQWQAVLQAYNSFLLAVRAIRENDATDFLVPLPSFEEISRSITAAGEALVYLAAGTNAGTALVITRDSEKEACHIQHIRLPLLSEGNVSMLWQRQVNDNGKNKTSSLEDEGICGGFGLAQLGTAFKYLLNWGSNISDAQAHLPTTSNFAIALERTIQEWRSHPKLHSLLAKLDIEIDRLRGEAKHYRVYLHDAEFTKLIIPVPQSVDDFTKPTLYTWDELEGLNVFINSFTDSLLQMELQQLLPALAEMGMRDLAQRLREQGIRKLALIPFGYLGSMPLPAVPISVTPDGKWQCLGDLFEVSIAPSARAFEVAKKRAEAIDPSKRPFISAVGNPQPLPDGGSSLEFAEAEAKTVKNIAIAFGHSPEQIHSLTLNQVAREQVITALQKSWYAHLAIHGQYQPEEPMESRLVLANGETISLEECLDGTINLLGMRLLVLSACETSIIDVQRAADEVIGMATGFLQAGAAAVIASLWPVDDHATYLLMSRFMSLFLNPKLNWTPVRCLAEAQRWLREEATNAVLVSYDPTTSMPGIMENPKMHGSSATPTHRSEQVANLSAKRSLRFGPLGALAEIRAKAILGAPHVLPYADPIYWAAFTVTGY